MTVPWQQHHKPLQLSGLPLKCRDFSGSVMPKSQTFLLTFPTSPHIGLLLTIACVYKLLTTYADNKTHTHTDTHLTALFSGTTQVSQYQKGRTNLDFTEARDSEWQWHQLGNMQVCTSLQTDNHASTRALVLTTKHNTEMPMSNSFSHTRYHWWQDTIFTYRDRCKTLIISALQLMCWPD